MSPERAERLAGLLWSEDTAVRQQGVEMLVTLLGTRRALALVRRAAVRCALRVQRYATGSPSVRPLLRATLALAHGRGNYAARATEARTLADAFLAQPLDFSMPRWQYAVWAAIKAASVGTDPTGRRVFLADYRTAAQHATQALQWHRQQLAPDPFPRADLTRLLTRTLRDTERG